MKLCVNCPPRYSCLFNSYSHGQNCHHFPDDIFKSILTNEKFVILFKLQWSLFLRIQLTIVLHWFGAKPLSELMLNQFTAHYDDVIMGTIASQITSLTNVYSTVYSGADQSKHQSSASLAFVWGIHRGPVNSPHKWPVTRKMFPFDDVIMSIYAAIGGDMLNCDAIVCGSAIGKC